MIDIFFKFDGQKTVTRNPLLVKAGIDIIKSSRRKMM